ncbi:MAG: HNH endonuclease [Bacteroidaceae bacterium]|nr:HNH endonuclease [Bacteroidaceae bacterium]
MEEEPIYEFKGLKNLLTSLGYQVEKATGYREVENVDVDLNDLQNNIDFTEDGIFLIDANDGSRQQIFLYKRNYRLRTYGKPRFHIRKCKVIQDFMDLGTFRQEYRRANTNPVLVCDVDDNNTDKLVDDLPLCKYCARMVAQEYQGMHSKEFVEILREASENSEENIGGTVEVDIFGYTKDWEMISKAYREEHNYTCECCGVHIDDPYDYYYMHVHHINGDKTNNRKSNLRCLCIRCHSQVDEIHISNFSKGAKRILVSQFNEKYPHKTPHDGKSL